MDYMELIKRSLANAWKYKFLWFFGFFVAAADSMTSLHWQVDQDDLEKWDLDRFGDINIEPAVIGLIILAVLAVAIVFWIMSVLCEGSLIHGITRKEQGQQVTFGDCWTAGADRFLRLFVIMFLATVAVIASVITLLVIIVPSYFAFLGLGILLTLVALPVLIALILVVVGVEGWAIRFAVLYNQPWLDAIGHGWNLFKANIGATMGVAFSSLLTQLALWCALVVALVLVAVPFVVVGMAMSWVALVPGVALGLAILILASAYFGTFASSIWTLGFMRLTQYGVAQPVAAPSSVG
ncbi:MAG TPA: hypothetical protein VN285_13670 [Candidatus Deferrimicrobium sp.]|nr:hypothetical protein [Candidatus Deferrimicrobium sp.]